MRRTLLMAAILLAGCGGQPANTTTATGTAASGAPAITSKTPLGTGTTDCSTTPDFAPIYPGATIVDCSSHHFDSTGKDAGSVISHTDAAPAAVLAWAKEATAKAGLKPGISLPDMYSAIDGTKRTTMIHVEADGSGTKVVTNWGKTP
jgi:hypothetical protein